MKKSTSSTLVFQQQPRRLVVGSFLLLVLLAPSSIMKHNLVIGQITTSDDPPLFTTPLFTNTVTEVSDVPSNFDSDVPSSFDSDVPSSFDSDVPSSFDSDVPSSFDSDVPSSIVNSDSPSSTPSSIQQLEDPIGCGKNNTICADGAYCCNPSCGICAPVGGACILMVCADDDTDDSILDTKNDRSSDSPSHYGSDSTATTIPPSDLSSNPLSDTVSDFGSDQMTITTTQKDVDVGERNNPWLSDSSRQDNTIQYVMRDETTPDNTIQYVMPDETTPHIGTWLQWPHQYQYGFLYRNGLDQTWIDMTKALITSENVYIIAYNNRHKRRIQYLLQKQNVPMKYENNTVQFYIYRTDDVWVRDNGPIFVRDIKTNEMTIIDFGFNGWGNKVNYKNCDTIPSKIATERNVTIVNWNYQFIVEGGSYEIDGRGTFLATRSSIINDNRNPNMDQATIETVFTKSIGVTNFIWLDGVAGLEITDMHIDGFARFGTPKTIVTMEVSDLLYWEVPLNDIETLYNATAIDGKAYEFVYVPLTKNTVKTAYGKQLGYKGSYVNFYTANTVVLVPTYNDPNDSVAIGILQKLYPNHLVVGIDVRNLYESGGMVHCVTQQQPL